MVETARASNGKFVKGAGSGNTGNIGNSNADDGAASKNLAGDTIIDPAELSASSGGGNSDTQPKRKPGRPAGTKTGGGKDKKEAAVDLSALNALLFSTHMMVAALLKSPEFALSQEESDTLAKACSNVSRHYDIKASQKALDWGNLAFCMGATYAPRFYQVGQRKREERNAKKAETAINGVYHPLG